MPVPQLGVDRLLRLAAGRKAVEGRDLVHGLLIEAVQLGERPQHVVEPLVVGPGAAGHVLHDEERMAENARVGLLPQDGRNGIAARPQDPHDGRLAAALGGEHAVLLDPHHAVPAGPAHVEHEPAEPSGDDGHILQPGSWVRPVR